MVVVVVVETQKLPPTRAALHEAIARAHFQAMVWYQDNTPHPQLPPATGYGWKEEQDILVPVPTGDPPAPAAITNLVKCGCRKTNCRSHCFCRSQNLNCSETCVCVKLMKKRVVTSSRKSWGLMMMRMMEILPLNQHQKCPLLTNPNDF